MAGAEILPNLQANGPIHEFIPRLYRFLQNRQVIAFVQQYRNLMKILPGHEGRLRASQIRVNRGWQ